MSDSEDSSLDENVEEIEEKEIETEEKFDRSKVPKHLKTRYWNSWEEMRLIELWRLHFSEVTDLDHNLPVYKVIGAGLRESGYHMYAQEIRRKMRSMKNKYIQEKRRIKAGGGASEWRLYRLMDCIMAPRRPDCDLHYDEKALAAITAKNESEPLFHILASGMPVNETLKRIEGGEKVNIPPPKKFDICFPIENKKIAASIILAYENKHRLSFTPRVHRHNYELSEQAKRYDRVMWALTKSLEGKPETSSSSTLPPLPAPPLSPKPINALELDANQQQRQQLKQRTTFFNGQGILKTKVNEYALAKIRAENRELMEEVVLSTKKLKQEEQQLKSYEVIMSEVKCFYEKVFEKLEIGNANA